MMVKGVHDCPITSVSRGYGDKLKVYSGCFVGSKDALLRDLWVGRFYERWKREEEVCRLIRYVYWYCMFFTCYILFFCRHLLWEAVFWYNQREDTFLPFSSVGLLFLTPVRGCVDVKGTSTCKPLHVPAWSGFFCGLEIFRQSSDPFSIRIRLLKNRLKDASNKGTSINCRGHLEYKADGAQKSHPYPPNEVIMVCNKLIEVP